MSLRINTNSEALNGYRQVSKNTQMLGVSLQRLSSGLRINKASDDAAGLVISEQMRAQITGLNQALANSETAVNMVQTAEGSLDEMNSLLKKVRSLALHASNAAPNDTNQLVADQSELDNAVASISRIAQTTQFGTKKLLDGTLSAANSYDTTKVYKFEVGSNLLTRTDYTGGAASIVIDSSAQTATVLQTDGAYTASYATSASFTGVMTDMGTTSLSQGATAGVTAASIGGLISNADKGGFTVNRALGLAAGETSLGTFFATSTNVLGIGSFAVDSIQNSAVAGVSVRQGTAIEINASITMRVGDTVFGFADGTTVSQMVSTVNEGQSVYSVTVTSAAAGGLELYNKQTGQLGAARDYSVNVAYSANFLLSGAGAGTAASATSFHAIASANFTNTAAGNISMGHDMATTIKLNGAGTVTGVTLGGSLNETSAGVFTATGGTSVGNTIRDAIGVYDNKLISGASMVITVAGKDYSFANGETIRDMVSAINSAQTDYTLAINRDTGLQATRNKIGDGGAVTDLSFRVTDVAGNTGTMTSLSTTAVDREVAGSGSTAGMDQGVNINAHIAGNGLPGLLIGLTSTGADASVLTNSAYGITIQLDKSYAQSANNTDTSTNTTVAATMTKGALFQVGPNASQLAGIDLANMTASRLGLGGDTTNTIRSLAELTSKGALVNGYHVQALNVIDKAIDNVTVIRGNLGAFQANTLESGLNSLRSTQENLSNAESTIRDTDFAKESSIFARNQILVQSSTAMLAQANQLSQGVLQLLGR